MECMRQTNNSNVINSITGSWKTKHGELSTISEKEDLNPLPSFDIPLKAAAVKCGLGYQGKSTLLVTPHHGPRVGLISVLTTAELDIDEPYKEDFYGNCEKCILACPTKALEPYGLKMNRCMTYSAESPNSSDVVEDVRELERKLVAKPTQNSYIECTTCIDVCPIGKPSFRDDEMMEKVK